MGVEPRTVMDIMGWSQLSMLARYQHVIDEVRRDAAAKVGEALWSTPQGSDPGPGSERFAEDEAAGNGAAGDTVVSVDFRPRRAG